MTEASNNEKQPIDSKFKNLPDSLTNKLFGLESPENSLLAITYSQTSNFRKHFEDIDGEEEVLNRRKYMTVSVKEYVFIKKLEESAGTSLLN